VRKNGAVNVTKAGGMYAYCTLEMFCDEDIASTHRRRTTSSNQGAEVCESRVVGPLPVYSVSFTGLVTSQNCTHHATRNLAAHKD